MHTSILVALVAINVLQLAMLVRGRARLQAAERINDRLSHFAEALALLTDTTEAGLAGVAAALDRGRRTARTGTRAAASKRIVAAVKTGRSVAQIAADEAVSESEIRLHLGMSSDCPEAKEERHGALRG